jgi:ketosteroid isomerase-like protein
MIAAEERLLDLIGPATKVIPGHGPLATRADLQAAHDMLVTVRDRVAVLVQEKKTLAEALAAEPVFDLDAQWGKGSLKAADFVGIVYADLSRGTAGDAPDHALAEAAVREAVLAANRAYAENDMPEYWATYAPDLIMWLPEGRVDLATYRKDWTQFLKDGGRVEAAEVSELVIQVSPAADAAVASYVLGVRTREVGGALKEEVVHETDVWMRRGGSWTIAHLHYTPVSTRTTPAPK